MLPGDDADAAARAAARFQEPRAHHYWDRERHLSAFMAGALAIDKRRPLNPLDVPRFAWDIFLLYPPAATDLSRPAFWMHQLDVPDAPRLHTPEFRRRVAEAGGQG